MVAARKTRKPMDKLNGFDSREAVWGIIREKRVFNTRDIHEETTLDKSSVSDYLVGLTEARYLSFEMTDGCKVFTLIRDVGVDAPRVRKDGSLVTQGQGRINMWRTMRILGTFSPIELAANSSTEECLVKVSSAKDYALHLSRAGYLAKLPGDRYRFLQSKYTGPKPPMIQRVKRVFDQNLKKVMWSEEGVDND